MTRGGLLLAASAWLTACGAELSVDPVSIDWGTVDFNQPLPDPGHDPREVELVNSGSGELEVVVLDLDTDRLRLGGQLTSADPPRLVLGPGDVAVLTLGVSGYEPGETGQEITGAVRFASGRLGDDVLLEWSYVPERDAPSD